MLGWFPLSHLIAQATASPFSHTGIIAIEDGEVVVYDCSSSGIQRQPFHVWMLDCVGPLGVKRLKPEHRDRIRASWASAGRCSSSRYRSTTSSAWTTPSSTASSSPRRRFGPRVWPCLEPVRIGDWEDLVNYPLTAYAFIRFSGLVLESAHHAGSARVPPGQRPQRHVGLALAGDGFLLRAQTGGKAAADQSSGLNLRGDFALAMFVAGELRRSYSELPVRWLCDVVLTL